MEYILNSRFYIMRLLVEYFVDFPVGKVLRASPYLWFELRKILNLLRMTCPCTLELRVGTLGFPSHSFVLTVVNYHWAQLFVLILTNE